MQANLTDRAKRYRAQEHVPAGEPCFACGNPVARDIAHVNGKESDGEPKNLSRTCRSCNVTMGNVLRKAGLGKKTAQYNPGATSLGAYLSAIQVMKGEVSGDVGAAVELVRETSAAKRSSFAREIWRTRRDRYGKTGRQNAGEVTSPTSTSTEVRSPTSTSTEAYTKGNFTATVTGGAGKGANTTVLIRPNGRRRNPADLASEAFEAFHGHPPSEEIVFESMEHEHEFYAGIGELMSLVIVPEGQRKGILLRKFDGAQLSMNENPLVKGKALTQLFIVGGDQELDRATLRQFGISHLHEQEVLGKCVDIVYFTTKSHLGRDGGEADYHHRFSEDTAGKNVRLRILKSPTATYHVVNKIIGLWGGVYQILPEGIAD